MSAEDNTIVCLYVHVNSRLVQFIIDCKHAVLNRTRELKMKKCKTRNKNTEIWELDCSIFDSVLKISNCESRKFLR